MPKRKGNFNAWRLETLADPINAANYLSAALEDSPEIFLDAIKDVIQSGSVSRVAEKAKVTRESLYRSFSATGNPTLETLSSVLNALGLKLAGVAPDTGAYAGSSATGSVAATPKPRRKSRRRGSALNPIRQLSFPFSATAATTSAVATVNVAKVGDIGKIGVTQDHLGTITVPRIGTEGSSDKWLIYPFTQPIPLAPTYAYAQ